jgi:hypothetical protein
MIGALKKSMPDDALLAPPLAAGSGRERPG